MSAFITRNLTSIIILASISLGCLLPETGLVLKPYLPYLLMLLMFISALGIEPKQVSETAKNLPLMTLGLFMVFIFTPLLAFPSKLFFSPIVFAGILLAFSAPSAIATTFWAGVFKGDIAYALILSTLANVVSVVTIPATMLLATGTAATVDLNWMTLNLAQLILIPIALAFLLKRVKTVNWKKATAYGSKIQLGILVLLIWGSIAPGARYAMENPVAFAQLNVYMLIALAIAFTAAYILGRRFSHKQAITTGIAACVKNAALALVIGATLYGSEILPPLIANLIAQNLLLMPLQLIVKEK